VGTLEREGDNELGSSLDVDERLHALRRLGVRFEEVPDLDDVALGILDFPLSRRCRRSARTSAATIRRTARAVPRSLERLDRPSSPGSRGPGRARSWQAR
jgi:hypothetical protein